MPCAAPTRRSTSPASYRVGIPASERPSDARRERRHDPPRARCGVEHRGLARIVYVSTVNVFGNTHGRIVDERYRRDLARASSATTTRPSSSPTGRSRSGSPPAPDRDRDARAGLRPERPLGHRRAAQGARTTGRSVRRAQRTGISPVHVDDVARRDRRRARSWPDRRDVRPRRAATCGCATRMAIAARVGGQRLPALALPTGLIRLRRPRPARSSPACRLPRRPRARSSRSAPASRTGRSSAKAAAELGYARATSRAACARHVRTRGSESPARAPPPIRPEYTPSMARELPMFEPAPVGGHDPHARADLPIALGGGLAGEPAATGRRALRRHPDWIRARMPSGENYHDLKGLLRGLEPQHRLRGGPLPEHRGVLGPAHRDDHDPRRHLHPSLRLLRRQDRPPDLVRRRRAAARRRGRRRDAASSTSSSRASPATTCPTAARGSSPRRSARCASASPGMGIEVLIPDFDGADDAAADGHGRAARHPQPQPRDRAAAPEAGPQARPLGPLAVRPARAKEMARRDRLRRPHEDER